MAQRVVAAAIAALAVSILAPARLGGEPATSSAVKRTTTTPTTESLPQDPAPNPLRLYPGRPAAKYEDVEARPHAALTLGGTELRIVSSTIEPRSSLPKGFAPSAVATYEQLGLLDGYAPRSTGSPGQILRVVVHMKPTLLPAALTCVATIATDGTVLVPYPRPAPRSHPRASTTTKDLRLHRRPSNVTFDLPLGGHRGRVFLTCRNTFFPPEPIDESSLFRDDFRAVWAIDV